MYLSLVNEENYQISLGRVFFLLNQIVGLAFLFIYYYYYNKRMVRRGWPV